MRARLNALWDGMIHYAGMVALVLAAGACLLSVALYEKITDEGAERRDQACRGLELGHKQEIEQLRRSYSFYEDPPPSFRDLLKDPRALAQLADQVRNAVDDEDQYGVFVPSYCDESGFGLPEPDPQMPAPPPGLLP